MQVGQHIHSGFSGGFCMKWTVINKSEYRAFLEHKNGTIINVDGVALRKWATYLAENCPLCDLQSPIEVDSPEVVFLRQDLDRPSVESAFKFKAAQFVTRRRNANR
jgi:hypothetical protein